MVKKIISLLIMILLFPVISASCSDISLQVESVDFEDNYVVVQRLMGEDDSKVDKIDEMRIYIDNKLELAYNKSIQKLESRRLKIPTFLSEDQEIRLEADFSGETCEYTNCKIGECKSYQELQLEASLAEIEEAQAVTEKNTSNEGVIEEETVENNTPSEVVVEEPKNESDIVSEEVVEIIELTPDQPEANSSSENTSINPTKIILNWIVGLFK